MKKQPETMTLLCGWCGRAEQHDCASFTPEHVRIDPELERMIREIHAMLAHMTGKAPLSPMKWSELSAQRLADVDNPAPQSET